jgi:hypothetical protein
MQVVRLVGEGSHAQVYECLVYGVRVAVKQLRQGASVVVVALRARSLALPVTPTLHWDTQ